MENYFVIHNSDGDTTVTQYTKEELLEQINDNAWGSNVDFIGEIPSNGDTNYWGEGILIIKGSISLPIPKKVITEYDI